jgi:hypothetical protein
MVKRSAWSDEQPGALTSWRAKFRTSELQHRKAHRDLSQFQPHMLLDLMDHDQQLLAQATHLQW